ncbi:MAG: hypothetical protein JSU72_07740 [Deltaproteobacteria bacterium]|nr:MAG: hypothetical protein JSU72_07740 [Deltaproteobacteria bacterium]
MSRIDSKAPSSHAVTVAVLKNLTGSCEREEEILFELADSDDYLAAKAAIQTHVEIGIEQHRRLVELFWKLCRMASQGEYAKDKALQRIFNDMDYHVILALRDYLKEAITSKIDSISDHAVAEIKKKYDFVDEQEFSLWLGTLEVKQGKIWESYTESSYEHLLDFVEELIEVSNWDIFLDRRQAQMYIDAYNIFEIITYYTMFLRDEVALSGVYSRYNPTTINLHFAMYRLIMGTATIPNFYADTERLMYTLVTSGDIDTYKEIWNVLYVRNPLLDYGISSLLFSVNSKGLSESKRGVRLIYSETYPGNLAAMISSLLTKHLNLKAELVNVSEALREFATYAAEYVPFLADDSHELRSILYVNLGLDSLLQLNSKLKESLHEWQDINKLINMITLVPKEKKLQYDTAELTMIPNKTFFYDPANPFDPNSDVLTAIEKSFQDMVLRVPKS